MRFLENFSQWLNTLLLWVGGGFLVGMMLLACANILLRAVWAPIQGAFELMGFFGAIVAAFALGSTQQQRGHIAVTVLINTFPAWLRRILRMVNSTLCLVFFGIVTWQIIKKATILRNTGEVTETLRIIYYPFTYAVAVGCAVLSLRFLFELFQAIVEERDTLNNLKPSS
jgi:TRAP-type C4-dicarboxylate transport system permease small subunit